MRFETDSVRAAGHIKNVSKGGLFIRADVLPMPGDSISIRFESRDGAKLELRGEVRWTTAQVGDPDHVKGGFGVQLAADDPDWQSFFEDILFG